ncbi:hypothetical protein C0J52_20018 [Blattella germanica]|nr:hypothetical protein C0J52_20018 [Blattella germanica]
MAAIMNPQCEIDEIEDSWEAGCALLVLEKSQLRYEKAELYETADTQKAVVLLTTLRQLLVIL